jgi:hypothetical protein
MAQIAVRLDPASIQLVPDKYKTPEMCASAVEKDWLNLRFVPEEIKTKELCETAMERSSHAHDFVPEEFMSPEMYMFQMKINGLNLECVPIKYRTPEVCLQAVISNPDAVDFVPPLRGAYNVYDFYGKLQNEIYGANQLSFEQVQKAFNGETVNVSGMKFFNATLGDFSITRDLKTNEVNFKALDEKLYHKQDRVKTEKTYEIKQTQQNDRQQQTKRKGVKM